MDTALRLEWLREAIGSHPGRERRTTVPPPAYPPAPLPTAEQLQELLGDADTQLFLNRRSIPTSLLRAAWYLHGIASADVAVQRYTVARQRRAFAVSAHIFDLATRSDDISEPERLQLGFAAEVGYLRSEAEPNAMAVARRRSSRMTRTCSIDYPYLPYKSA
jgi:hypothetical protein